VRLTYHVIASLAAALALFPTSADAAATSVASPSPGIPPKAIILQPVHPGPVAACHPANGVGDIVDIPGMTPFEAESVTFSEAPSTHVEGPAGRRVGRGTVTVVRKIGASLAQIHVGGRGTSDIPSMTITLRQGRLNSYMVVTLEQTSVTSEWTRNVSGAQLETLVFSFASLYECQGM
jgi:hypothetical protein